MTLPKQNVIFAQTFVHFGFPSMLFSFFPRLLISKPHFRPKLRSSPFRVAHEPVALFDALCAAVLKLSVPSQKQPLDL